MSRLVLRAREQAADALRRRREIEVLYDLSIDLFTTTNRVGVLGEAASRALRLVGARGGGLLENAEGSNRPTVVSWSGRSLAPEHERLVQVVLDRGEVAEVPAPGGARDVRVSAPRRRESERRPRRARDARGPNGARPGGPARRPRHRAGTFSRRERPPRGPPPEREPQDLALARRFARPAQPPHGDRALDREPEAAARRAGRGARTALDDLERESGRLARRIDNLLALARLEAGRSVPNAEPTPPAGPLPGSAGRALFVLVAHPVHVCDRRPTVIPTPLVDPLLRSRRRCSGPRAHLVAERGPRCFNDAARL